MGVGQDGATVIREAVLDGQSLEMNVTEDDGRIGLEGAIDLVGIDDRFGGAGPLDGDVLQDIEIAGCCGVSIVAPLVSVKVLGGNTIVSAPDVALASWTAARNVHLPEAAAQMWSPGCASTASVVSLTVIPAASARGEP
jgi:hypothetical protein